MSKLAKFVGAALVVCGLAIVPMGCGSNEAVPTTGTGDPVDQATHEAGVQALEGQTEKPADQNPQ